MAKTFRLSIASASEVFFHGEATSVSVPTTAGQLQILADHEPIIVTLKEGDVRYVVHEQVHAVPVTRGVVEMSQGACSVLL